MLNGAQAVLLYGPPSCGKPYVAEAIAGELGIPLVFLHIQTALNMYVGNSEKSIHCVFLGATRLAKEKGRYVLLMDEFDALGTSGFVPQRRVYSELNRLLTDI